MSKLWVVLGAVFGFLSVVFGAFGGHVLKTALPEKYFSIFQVGIQYQIFHALALLGLGLWAGQNPGVDTSWVGWAFTLGIVVFSGSLYLLSLSQVDRFGMITPIGGISFLAGWIGFAFLAWRA